MHNINSYFNRLSKYEKLALLVSGFMLLFLLVLSYFHKMGNYGIETDFYWAYAPDAQNILDGKSPEEPGAGPGYALVLAFTNLFFNDWFLTGKIISVLSAVFCGFLTFKVVQSLFTEKVAFFTLILWHVTVLPFAIVTSNDMFFAFLFAAAIYYLFKNKAFSIVNLAVSAFFMGYAYLTRHNAIVLPFCAVMIILFINPDSWSWSERLKSALIFIGIFLCVLAPWWLVLYASSGSAVRSDSYLIIASHFYGQPSVVGSEDMRLAAQKFDSLKSVIFYDFTYFIKHYVFNIYHHFYDVLIKSLKFPTFLFIGGGAILLFSRANKRQLAFFVFPLVSFLLLCLVHYEPRYYLYFIAYFILFAVYFLFQENQKNDNQMKWSIPFLREVVFAATVFFVLTFSLKEVKQSISDEPRELLEISKYLRQHVQEKTTIIARKPHIGFLSNLETKYFPDAKTLNELLEYASQEKARYLVYGEVEYKRRPEFKFLLEPENLPDDLELFYLWDNPRTVIYKLRI